MARKRNKLKLRKSVAIVGEGHTEFFYFNDYRITERKNIKIKPELPKHTDIRSIVKTARGLIEHGYDHVYCVFDLDRILSNEKENEEYSKLKNQNRKNIGITFFESMPCFEFWFLLHFKYSTKQHESCSTCVDDLKKYIHDYDKNREYQRKSQFYSLMKENGKLKIAMENSKRIYDESNNEITNGSQSYSMMHILLEELDKID